MSSIRGRWFGIAVAGVLAAACSEAPSAPSTLPAPTELRAEASARQVTLRWAAVAGAETYVLERASGEGAFAPLAEVSATVYTDTAVAPQTLYRYRVAARRGGSVGPAAEIRVTTSARPVVLLEADIVRDRTLTPDTLYRLATFVHVKAPATLRILAGTRIEGLPGSALFIERGAKIDAQGTASAPIVLTSAQPEGQRQPGDWGGLVVIGNARINRSAPVLLEGTGTGPSNPPLDYGGGTDDNDSSGTLRYVRVEFAGFGPLPDAELNSFTFAAVGRGTRCEYLQSLAGLDDSFEWFGGTVDCRYLVSYESGDDHFDASEGYRGRVQFAIALQTTILPPRPGAGQPSNDPQGVENDGCAGSNCPSGQNSTPYTEPVWANFTLVGTGPGVSLPPAGGLGVLLRRGTAGHYVNFIVARWPNAALSLRDAATQERLQAGLLSVRHMLLVDNARVFQEGSNQFALDPAAAALEVRAEPAASVFVSLPATPTAATLDWTPAPTFPARSGGASSFSGRLAELAGAFVVPTPYRGAADPNGPKWWQGWTAYARN